MKSKKVLIVDDNDLNRKLFENLIGKLYSIESAKNGIEAVDLAKKGNFDLILMDIQMPKMDGITAMKKIRQEGHCHCPIWAVTAYAEESDRYNFLEQGFDEFITKPIRPKEFLQIIQTQLIGQQPISEEVIIADDFAILDKKILDQLFKYNSKSAIKKVFGEFLLECTEMEIFLGTLDSSIPDAVLLEKIHTLKGNSGTLGAMGIYRATVKVEASILQENKEETGLEIKKLKNEIRQFRDFHNQELIFEL